MHSAKYLGIKRPECQEFQLRPFEKMGPRPESNRDHRYMRDIAIRGKAPESGILPLNYVARFHIICSRIDIWPGLHTQNVSVNF